MIVIKCDNQTLTLIHTYVLLVLVRQFFCGRVEGELDSRRRVGLEGTVFRSASLQNSLGRHQLRNS